MLVFTTWAQMAFLLRAEELENKFNAGIFPRGGQYKMVCKLESKGLLYFDGDGRDIDGEVEKDVPVWRLTTKGRQLLEESTEPQDCKGNMK